jgi:S1-C subfamily serine protease
MSENNQPAAKSKNFFASPIFFVLVTVVVGFISGITGYAVINYYFGRVNVSDAKNDQQIVIEQPRNVIVQADVQFTQVENDLLPALINIYDLKKETTNLNKLYLPSELLGQGFVLTADGWAVTSKNAIANLKYQYQVVGYQMKEYEIGDFIVDDATGLVFGKMSANNLTVAKIGNDTDLQTGQNVVVSNGKKLVTARIKDIGYNFKVRADAVQSSESLNKQIFLDVPLDSFPDGAVVANLKAEIIGVIAAGRVVPIDYLKTAINQALGGQKITRPVLGIDYIDLAQVDGLGEISDRGALVSGAPAKTSPASGKLKDGDRIKKVNDQELNVYQGLSEVLIQYKKGDKVDFLVTRNGQDQTVEITLN